MMDILLSAEGLVPSRHLSVSCSCYSQEAQYIFVQKRRGAWDFKRRNVSGIWSRVISLGAMQFAVA